MSGNGPGKYDDACTLARAVSGGHVLLMVVGGIHGSGFSVQGDSEVVQFLPELLRDTANRIEQQINEGKKDA